MKPSKTDYEQTTTPNRPQPTHRTPRTDRVLPDRVDTGLHHLISRSRWRTSASSGSPSACPSHRLATAKQRRNLESDSSELAGLTAFRPVKPAGALRAVRSSRGPTTSSGRQQGCCWPTPCRPTYRIDLLRIAWSINGVFDDADVILTPLCESPAPNIDDCPTRGANRSLRKANTSAWLIPWNLTGQPAIVVPTGIDDDNMPTAVQLVGQAGDEATLLSLATQIESAQPFPVWAGSSPV